MKRCPKEGYKYRPSLPTNRRKTRNKIINKTSYFLFDSLNKSLNQKWKLMISPKKDEPSDSEGDMEARSPLEEEKLEKWIPFQQ